jgi:hypothetical protein
MPVTEVPGSPGFGYKDLLADGSKEAVTWMSPGFNASGVGQPDVEVDRSGLTRFAVEDRMCGIERDFLMRR